MTFFLSGSKQKSLPKIGIGKTFKRHQKSLLLLLLWLLLLLLWLCCTLSLEILTGHPQKCNCSQSRWANASTLKTWLSSSVCELHSFCLRMQDKGSVTFSWGVLAFLMFFGYRLNIYTKGCFPSCEWDISPQSTLRPSVTVVIGYNQEFASTSATVNGGPLLYNLTFWTPSFDSLVLIFVKKTRNL